MRAELPLKKLAKVVPEGRAEHGAARRARGAARPAGRGGRARRREDARQATGSARTQPRRRRGRACRGRRHRTPVPTRRAPCDATRRAGSSPATRRRATAPIKGGVRFVAAYPITPATELLEWMSPALAQVGGTLVQAEDELASINMAIGGSYGGVPSLTATSGPGLVADGRGARPRRRGGDPARGRRRDARRARPPASRPSPSRATSTSPCTACTATRRTSCSRRTRSPTASARRSGRCSWPRRCRRRRSCCRTSSSARRGRSWTVRAATSPTAPGRLVAAAIAPGYRRYALTPDGVSPMAIPGTAGVAYTADGLEHAERGTPSSQAADHFAQLDKRRAQARVLATTARPGPTSRVTAPRTAPS